MLSQTQRSDEGDMQIAASTSGQLSRQFGRGRHQSVQAALLERSCRNGSRLPVVVLGRDLASGTVLQLNLLRKLNATPTVLVHAYLCGQQDYNAMPLLPIGLSLEVHVKTGNRKSWDFHFQPE